jgi:hypothetical protein
VGRESLIAGVRPSEIERNVTQMSLLVRLGVSAAAGIGTAVVAALVVTVIDLYVTGHGYGSITREVITWGPGGVHLSIGDVCMLVAVIVVSSSTWYFIGRGH